MMLSTLRISRLHLYKYLFKHKYVNLSTGASDQNEKLLRVLEDDSNLKSHYDCIVIGAGHNGLIAATYLQRAGLNVCVLEKRHVIGGAAVTEEIIPGFKFSRASYVLSLLRPQIIEDLELMKYGLKLYFRDPHSYTPVIMSEGGKTKHMSLSLGRDVKQNVQQIAQFSNKDAVAYIDYEKQLQLFVDAIEPLLDVNPVHIPTWTQHGILKRKVNNWPSVKALLKTAKTLHQNIPEFYQMLTAPAVTVLNKWFESEPLKATLATDSVIGAMTSPQLVGSGYVLLHHVMGNLEGTKGEWAYVEGGMGALSEAIAQAARHAGVDIFVNKPVNKILVQNTNRVKGVVTCDGQAISAELILSNATPHITFLELLHKNELPEEFVRDMSHIDYTSPVTKINVAVKSIPNFLASPNKKGQRSQPHHQATIHLNCENMSLIHDAYLDAQKGIYSQKPVIEMTIPSSLDPTLAPPNHHVVQLFTQYTPYTLADGQEWTDELKNKYAKLVFENIEDYAPGFLESIIGVDILTPPDLEREFSLTGGNIFHGSMSLHQLYSHRPLPAYCDTRSPIYGLYLCGSGAHPGGGVMGSPGKLAAITALHDQKKK